MKLKSKKMPPNGCSKTGGVSVFANGLLTRGIYY